MRKASFRLLINTQFSYIHVHVVSSFFFSKAMVLCFKLYFIKDATICTTAAATVRQMVSVIFERVVTEDNQGLGKLFQPWYKSNSLSLPRYECEFSLITSIHFF